MNFKLKDGKVVLIGNKNVGKTVFLAALTEFLSPSRAIEVLEGGPYLSNVITTIRKGESVSQTLSETEPQLIKMYIYLNRLKVFNKEFNIIERLLGLDRFFITTKDLSGEMVENVSYYDELLTEFEGVNALIVVIDVMEKRAEQINNLISLFDFLLKNDKTVLRNVPILFLVSKADKITEIYQSSNEDDLTTKKIIEDLKRDLSLLLTYVDQINSRKFSQIFRRKEMCSFHVISSSGILIDKNPINLEPVGFDELINFFIAVRKNKYSDFIEYMANINYNLHYSDDGLEFQKEIEIEEGKGINEGEGDNTGKTERVDEGKTEEEEDGKGIDLQSI